MLLEKLEKQDNFTETDKVIANYILDPHHSIAGITSSKLGQVTYTSQAAVMRLYKKLGIDSYRCFNSTIVEELTERKNLKEIDYLQPIKADMSVDEVIDTLAKFYVNEIYSTKLSIDKNQIQRLYNHLRNAESVQIYGGSTFIMKQLSNKISAFGIRCQTIETANEFKTKYFQIGEKVAIFISIERSNDHFLKDMAIQLKKDNIYIFGILNDSNNILASICHDALYIGNPSNQNIDNTSRVLYIIDIIYSMFLTHRQAENDNNV